MELKDFILTRIDEDQERIRTQITNPRTAKGRATALSTTLEDLSLLRQIATTETEGIILDPNPPWEHINSTQDGGIEIYGYGGILIATGENAERMILSFSTPVEDTPALRIIATRWQNHPDYLITWEPA